MRGRERERERVSERREKKKKKPSMCKQPQFKKLFLLTYKTPAKKQMDNA